MLVCKGVIRNVKDMMEDSVLMCLITDRSIEAGCMLVQGSFCRKQNVFFMWCFGCCENP